MDINKKYSISEASEIIGFSNHVIRFYENEFEIIVPRNKSNHRYYTYKEIEEFLYIKSLKERGLSNNQIKEVLKSPEIIMGSDEIAITNNDQITLENHLKPINQLNKGEVSNQFHISELKNIIETRIDDNFKYLSIDLIENVKKSLEEHSSSKNYM